jgi:hypothetical protein
MPDRHANADDQDERLAALTTEVVWLDRAASQPPATALTGARRVAATPAQLHLWLASELAADRGLLNDRIALRLIGDLDVQALHQAYAGLRSRHEQARLVFRFESAELVQYILPDAADDLHGLRSSASGNDLAARVRGESLRPFELSAEPPIRLVLFKAGQQDHVLLLVLHHIASDLESPLLLLQELAARYEAARTGVVPRLDPLPGYADTVHAQLDRLGPAGRDKLHAYWQNRLSGLPEAPWLPLDRQPSPDGRGGSIDVVLGAELSRQVSAAAAALRVSVFAFTLAAFRMALWRLTGASDLLVAAPFTTRFGAEAEGVTGPFLTMLALRNQLRPTEPVAEAVQRERASVLTAFAHSALPHGALVEKAREAGGDGFPGLPHVVFGYEEREPGVVSFPGLTCEPFDLGPTGSPYDLSVKVVREPDGTLVMRCAFLDLTDSAAGSFADGYVEILAAAAREPNGTIRALPAPFPPAAALVAPPPKPGRTDHADSHPGLSGAGHPPGTATERYIADIWSQVLDLAAVTDADRSIFELGAHSLLVARIAARLSEEFNTRITTAEIFARPTIAAQAELLDDRLLDSLAGSDPDLLTTVLAELTRTQDEATAQERSVR